jgi:hypothetical protein
MSAPTPPEFSVFVAMARAHFAARASQDAINHHIINALESLTLPPPLPLSLSLSPPPSTTLRSISHWGLH